MNSHHAGWRVLVAVCTGWLLAHNPHPLLAQSGQAPAGRTQSATPAAPPSGYRVVAGIGSADRVLNDLEYLVVKLAGKKDSWTNNVYPNLDIFLIGVSRKQPTRFDLILDAQNGQQMQTIVPISDLKEFLEDNLAPIGIDFRRDRADRNLYELTGDVYEGALRYLPEPFPYAVIFPQAGAVPSNMPHPGEAHKAYLEKGALAYLSLKQDGKDQPGRKAAFQKVAEKTLAELQKFPDESRAAFDLRKRMRLHNLQLMEEWFVEAGEVQLTLNVDQKKSEMPSALSIKALAGTALAKNIDRLAEEGSHFSAVTMPDDSTLKFHIHIPVNPERIPGYLEIYEMMRPVIKDKLAEDKDATDAQKAARQEIAGLFLDVLGASAPQHVINGFVNIYPANGKQGIVLGFRCLGQDKILEIIEKLPAAETDWSVAKDAEKIGDVSVHKLSFGGNKLKSLLDFYGDTDVYLATGKETFWLAGGQEGLAKLKEQLTAVENGSPNANGALLNLDFNAHAMLKHLHEYLNESKLGLTEMLNLNARLQQRTEQQTPNAEPDRPGRKAASNLQNFEWEEAAIAALQGQPDRVTFEIKRTGEGQLAGSANSQGGVLKAVGAIVAKFSDENLE